MEETLVKLKTLSMEVSFLMHSVKKLSIIRTKDKGLDVELMVVVQVKSTLL